MKFENLDPRAIGQRAARDIYLGNMVIYSKHEY